MVPVPLCGFTSGRRQWTNQLWGLVSGCGFIKLLFVDGDENEMCGGMECSGRKQSGEAGLSLAPSRTTPLAFVGTSGSSQAGVFWGGPDEDCSESGSGEYVCFLCRADGAILGYRVRQTF